MRGKKTCQHGAHDTLSNCVISAFPDWVATVTSLIAGNWGAKVVSVLPEFKMATPVPPSKLPTPDEYKPLPPAESLYEPDDYKEAFAVHKDHRGASKVSFMWEGLGPVARGWVIGCHGTGSRQVHGVGLMVVCLSWRGAGVGYTGLIEDQPCCLTGSAPTSSSLRCSRD